MPHRRKIRHRPVSLPVGPAEPDDIADRRIVANMFGAWMEGRCGRGQCTRAERCSAPGAPCFDEHRERLRGALYELADSALFDAPDGDGEG